MAVTSALALLIAAAAIASSQEGPDPGPPSQGATPSTVAAGTSCGAAGEALGLTWGQVNNVSMQMGESDLGPVFSWQIEGATLDAVIVDGVGSDHANLFRYIPPAPSDAGLHAPINSAVEPPQFFDVGAVRFCSEQFEEPPEDDPSPPPDPEPPPEDGNGMPPPLDEMLGGPPGVAAETPVAQEDEATEDEATEDEPDDEPEDEPDDEPEEEPVPPADPAEPVDGEPDFAG